MIVIGNWFFSPHVIRSTCALMSYIALSFSRLYLLIYFSHVHSYFLSLNNSLWILFDNMNVTRRSVSPTPSDSSVEIIVDSSPSNTLGLRAQPLPTELSNTVSSPWLDLGSAIGQLEVPHPTETAVRRWMKKRVRLLERLGPVKLAARDRRKIRSQKLKEGRAIVNAQLTRLFKDTGMKGEWKKAMKTQILPQSFQTIDVDEISDTDNESHLAQLDSTLGTELNLDCHDFAGQIIIQNPLEAMRQAWYDGRKPKGAGRHAFFADANHSGIGVVFKTNPRNWTSPWTVKGYQISKRIDSTYAETLAIWKALEIILERTYYDSSQKAPSNPCSLAVIFTDSQGSLKSVGKSADGGRIAQKIRQQARKLQGRGVNVQLHWVPGHKKIPGNALADRVAEVAKLLPVPSPISSSKSTLTTLP